MIRYGSIVMVLLLSACFNSHYVDEGFCRAGGLEVEKRFAEIEIYRDFVYEPFDAWPTLESLDDVQFERSLFKERLSSENTNNVLAYSVKSDPDIKISVIIDDNCWAETTYSRRSETGN